MRIRSDFAVFLGLVFAFFFESAETSGFREDFIAEISRRDGSAVHDYVTARLKGGKDRQIMELCKHMNDEGHFGDRQAKMTKHAVRSMPKRWATFFVKGNGELYSTRGLNVSERCGTLESCYMQEKYLVQVPLPLLSN